eukprot:446171-Prymnesium_polylepis.1
MGGACVRAGNGAPGSSRGGACDRDERGGGHVGAPGSSRGRVPATEMSAVVATSRKPWQSFEVFKL